MRGTIERVRRSIHAFYCDVNAVILPYMALFLTALIGLSSLAVDIGRQLSLQTQLQAVADALALAGARELNQSSGAQTRATSAINTMISNGLIGLGYSGSISHSITFYSALPAASAGYGGTAATSDTDSKYVGVRLTPVSITSMFNFAGSTLTAGAQAIAGFQGTAACGISPVFICNPYETSGMTDTQATQALHAALDPNDPSFSSANLRKMFRMDTSSTSPGHFGWLQPPDTTCNNTSCLNDWVSRDTKSSLGNACYDRVGVKMATGNKPLAGDFNDRFDIYSGNGPSSTYSPAINVRKGIVPGSGRSPYCYTGSKSSGAQLGDALSAQGTPVAGATVALAPVTNVVVTVTSSKGKMTATFSGGTPQAGMSLYETAGTLGSTTLGLGTTVSTVSGSTITFSSGPTKTGTATLNFIWLTAPLPLDKQWTGLCSGGTCVQGNGDWDCLNYWKINHTSAAPSGCTASSPTLSRYQVYQYENSQASNSPTSSPISDLSGYPTGVSTNGNGESGAPYCAINQGFIPTYDSTYEKRILYATVINCSAQASAISGGNSGGSVPVAGFAKFFLTQPNGLDSTQYIYGEMTGLVSSLSASKTYNQVQLYR